MAEWDWVGTIDPRDAMPLHAQLERSIRVAIASHWLKPGDQLPTVRQLAVELKINANTVARVYADLERSGAIETRRGVGSFVTASGDQARSRREHEKQLRAFVTRVLADGGTHGFTAEELINALSSHQSGGL